MFLDISPKSIYNFLPDESQMVDFEFFGYDYVTREFGIIFELDLLIDYGKYHIHCKKLNVMNPLVGLHL